MNNLISPVSSPSTLGAVRLRRTGQTALLGFVVVICASQLVAGVSASRKAVGSDGRSERITESLANVPAYFEANQGQVNPVVKFVRRGQGLTVFFTHNEVVLHISGRGKPPTGDQASIGGGLATGLQGEQREATVRMKLVGSNPDPKIEGLDSLPGRSHYLIGNDPKRWKRNVPLYGKAAYRQIYPGVDLVYYGRGRQLEYDFVVAPGADVGLIRLEFEGVDSLKLNGKGDLVLSTPVGEIRHWRPRIYQEAGGRRKRVAGGYVVQGGRRVTFHVGAYDRSRVLVIDPVLIYATYLGGRESERPAGIAVDLSGNIYVAGRSTSVDFPLAAPLQSRVNSGMAAFVTKLNASGSALLYSTYLGGTAALGLGFQAALALAVDTEGNAYVTGFTDAVDFPLTSSAVQRAFGGITDAFVSKLDATGSALLYSTYLGGRDEDAGDSIAIDAQGSAYVTGSTHSPDFPITGAVQMGLDGERDVFVARLNPEGSRLVYSTYIGGAGEETGFGIAIEAEGVVWITGSTTSVDFSVTPDALQPAYGGGPTDAFLTRLSLDDSAVIYSTYLGGSADDRGRSIVFGSQGTLYLAGGTNSPDFLPGSNRFRPPCPSNPLIELGITCPNIFPGFVIKLDKTTSDVAYSARMDLGVAALAVDASGNAYLAGEVGGTGRRPIFGGEGIYTGGSNLVVGKLNPSGSDLRYLRFFVGSDQDTASGIAIDPARNVYVVAQTNSPNLPLVEPLQRNSPSGSNFDAYIAKISETPVAGTFYYPQAGGGGGFSTEITLSNPSLSRSVNTTIAFFGSDGRPLQAIDTPATQAVIPPAGIISLQTRGDAAPEFGYARITVSGAVNSYATYRVPGLPLLDASPVTPGALTYSAPISRRGRETGVAVVNLSDQTVRVVLGLEDAQSRVVASDSLVLGPAEQFSRTLTELFPNIPDSFAGTLSVTGLAPLPVPSLVVTMLEYGPQLFNEVPLSTSR